ncbi:MAG TPA: chemotaxis protein CheA [Geobacteraceae bacterium]|nr:chemotaxis protein CheA [Geobacteraceae bacterium]
MDMSQYRDLFVAETKEHLGGMNECLSVLEKDPANREKIDSLFRSAHSVKGMGASMGYDDIAELAHAMEDLMDGVRRGEYAFAAAIADLLLEGVDRLSDMVVDVENGGTGSLDISDLVERLKGYKPGQEANGVSPAAGSEAESLSVVQQELKDAVRVSGEAVIRDGQVESWKTVRVKTEILDNLINTTGELVTARHRLAIIGRDLGSDRLNDAVEALTKLLRELHGEVMKVRLMPFAALAERFPRMVRDLAKKSGKEVIFEISGKDIEIDRGTLEDLADPLVHLLRNAIDHGLEKPDERLAAGKPAGGRIVLEARREKDQAVITVTDDGRGMDPARLIESAVERKLIREEEKETITPQQAFMLTCIPGFSTARQVTDISGRGVGMDVVRSSVLSLGGSLSIDSEFGRGTRIAVRVPHTVAIIQVLLVSCSSLTVGFPVARILRTLELNRDSIVREGKRDYFYLEDQAVPLASLGRLLGVKTARVAGKFVPVAVIEIREKKVGLVVDRFEGQQEVFLKPLGRPLGSLRCAAGAAILGDGRVIMVLDTAGLL